MDITRIIVVEDNIVYCEFVCNLLAREGIKFAVIVNDIGEINIDAELIQKDGIVGQKEESLVALQNACICCRCFHSS